MRYLFVLLLFLFSWASFGQDDEVYLLTARKEAHMIRHDVILEETKELRYNTFVFEVDDTGKSVLGLLVDAAKRGVKVKLIIDGMGEGGLVKNHALLAALQEMGVEIRIFNPMMRHPLSFNNRNHQKSVISSKKMIVGGRNTKSDYFDEFIDTEILVKGDEVNKAKGHFDAVFNSAEVKSPWLFTNEIEVAKYRVQLLEWGKEAKAKSYRIRHFEYDKVESAKYYADPPNLKAKQKSGINKQIVAMIDRAETELSFLNPYVYLSPDVKDAMERAIKRGVKIRIATNSKDVTDSVFAGIAWEAKKHELLDMGIEVHESGRYVHAKTIVRDGQEVFIGSFNMDMRSHNLNLENGIFIKSKKLADTIETHHRRLIRFFMKKVEYKVEGKVKSGAIKAAICIRKGYHKILSELAWPHL